MTEAQFQAQIIDLARLAGWRVHAERPAQARNGRWLTPIQGDAGFPDLVLIHPKRHRLVIAELKVGRNKPSAAQEAWLQAFWDLGIEAYLWRPEHESLIISTLTSTHRRA